jgi:multimeric flavodoxin WrbA
VQIVAFNGSARKDGNTAVLLQTVLDELEKEGIDTELVHLAGSHIHGCIACGRCFKNKDRQCAVKSDALNDYLAKMIEADGILIGSPTYFSDLTTETKALIDRAGYVARANGNLFKRKVGAAVVAVRRAGGIHVFDSINHLFLIHEMIVPGSSYWNVSLARDKGDAEKDEEGMRTMRTLGQNMAWLLKKLHTPLQA